MDASVLNLPATFRFPTKLDYAAEATSALRLMGGFNSDFVKTNLVAPVQSTFNSLVIGVEQAIGTTLDDVSKVLSDGVAGLKAMIPPALQARLGDIGKVSLQLANFIGALVSGNVRVIVKEGVQLGSQVVSLVSACIGTVPVVGQMVGMVLPLLTMLEPLLPKTQAEVEAARRQAIQKLTVELDQRCAEEARRWGQVAPTASFGATPADHFRSVFVAAQLGQPLPPSVASMFVLLCGAESQGVGFTRNEYASILGSAQTVYGKSWRGIDPEVQRRMWALCKSIMFAVEDPRLTKEIVFTGDGGVAAFAMLQDITRNQFRAGNWDERWLGLLSSYLGDRYSAAASPDTGTARSETIFGTCENRMRLDTSFLAIQRSWQNQLKDNFCDPSQPVPLGSKEQCVYRSTASEAQIAQAKKPTAASGGTLVVDAATAKRLGVAAKDSEQRSAQMSTGVKLGIGAGVIAAGAGLWALSRKP